MPERTVTLEPARSRPAPAPIGSAVSAVGVAVPEATVANGPIAELLGVDERWIEARTGVRERRVAAAGESVVGLASAAAGRALAAAALAPEAVDLVLVATMSHDRLTPGAAPLVADRIGASRAGAIDVGAACSGFVSALALAAGQVEAGRAGRVLVIGADVMSRLTDPTDRSTAALFGDGAGAVLVSAAAGHGAVGPAILGADGRGAELVTAERREAILRMKGHDTFRHAVDRLCEATLEALSAAGRSLDEIDVFAFHQANARILRAVGERLELEPSRVIDCIGRYGNTSAATVPLALADARDRGLLTPGASVLAAAFGGGLTWAALAFDWDPRSGDDRVA